MRVDPEVNRRKFKQQVDLLLMARDIYRRERGWIIEEVAYPHIFVVMLTPGHPFALFTVDLDFVDYNLQPPSVTFRDPVGRRPLVRNELPPALQRVGERTISVMIASHPYTRLPFLCFPGIREYHSHPQHTNDPWDAYRYDGSTGTAFQCLDLAWRYCVRSLPMMATPVGLGAERVVPE